MAKPATKALDFASIADRKLEEVERPPLPPAGTYVFQCTKMPEISTSNDGKWDIVNIPLRAVEAYEPDESMMEQIQAYGKVTNINLSHRFMFNKEESTEFERTQYNLKRCLEEHFKVEKGLGFKQALAAIVNQRVVASVVWKQDKNDAELYHANIGKTAPVEA